MIIRIQASGASFLGAGKYYLHDKLDAERAERAQRDEYIGRAEQTDERVWFTDTRNCLNSDPECAFEEMWRTAEDQSYLKMQAGVARGGRRCEDPVKTISLSWHKDDRPEPQHMVDSADAFLKHMGWDNHQAVYVGHNDTEHRHIHIVLNRIDPETGRTVDDYRERKRAQVWALSYEKEHNNVRCEERELRAAKREQRAPELNDGLARTHDAPSSQPTRTTANDHLPHNVVMLSRPIEQAFTADEQKRAARDEQDRAELKAHQRAEREAHFKEGSKLFKAARHAAYDEVRKAYKAEWRQFYKDARQAGFTAEFASDKAVKDAIGLAAAGRWDEARERFGTHDDVKNDLAEQFALRKVELEQRQKEDIAGRQWDVCEALRAAREVQYQDLPQRQRNERAAWTAGTTLATLGVGSPEPLTPEPANQNALAASHAAPSLPSAPGAEQAPSPAPELPPTEKAQVALMADMLTAIDAAMSEQKGGAVHLPKALSDVEPATTHQLTDLAAGGIGQVASYLADQLGELFAPTPPEVREANAKADAKREAEKPAPALEDKTAGYARHIEAAMRVIDAERREQEDRAYWEERDRGKGFERDR